MPLSSLVAPPLPLPRSRPTQLLKQYPMDFTDGQRIGLRRMALAFDHQFGLHAIDVGARILHHTIVAILQRAVLQCRDDGMGVNAGSDRYLAYRLDSWIAWRHAIDAVERAAILVQLHRVSRIGQQVG